MKSKDCPSVGFRTRPRIAGPASICRSRFPRHDHGLAIPVLGKVPVVRKEVELLSAANQWSNDLRFDRRLSLSFRSETQNRAHRADIFQFSDAEVLVGKNIAWQQALCGLSYDDRVRAGLGLRPARNICCFADDKLVRDHLAGVHPTRKLSSTSCFFLRSLLKDRMASMISSRLAPHDRHRLHVRRDN